jgi:hypothetical protein
VDGAVAPQLRDEHGRDGDRSPSRPALGIVLDHLARGQAEALAAHGDGGGGEVDVVPAEGEQLTLPEPGQPGGQDHGPVPVGRSLGERNQLGHGGEALLRVVFCAATRDAARVLGEQVVVHGRGEDLAQPRVRLGRHRGAVLAGQGHGTEGWDARVDHREDVQAQLRVVDLPRALGQAEIAPEPAPGVGVEDDAAGLGVDPRAFAAIGFHVGQPSGCLVLVANELAAVMLRPPSIL